MSRYRCGEERTAVARAPEDTRTADVVAPTRRATVNIEDGDNRASSGPARRRDGRSGRGASRNCDGGSRSAGSLRRTDSRNRRGGHHRGQRVTFNVSGYVFETELDTLLRYPDTLLGDPAKRMQFWDPGQNCFYLDRHAGTFQCVLYYYQSGGRLYRASEIPEDVFIDELRFYDLGRRAVQAFERRCGFLPKTAPRLPPSRLVERLRLTTEKPSNSVAAKLYALTSVLLTLSSTAAYCVESVPRFRGMSCNARPSVGGNRTDTFDLSHNYRSPFYVLEMCSSAWFTLEAVLRCVTSGDRARYFRSVENLFDLCAVLPFYASLVVLVLTDRCIHASPSDGSAALLRVLRLVSTVRVLKLTKYSPGARLLGYYLVRSFRECLLFLSFSFIAITSFSVAMYFADEHDSSSANVRSIPEALWYCVITFWTIGYGDVVPTGPAGKAVGALCMLSGVVSVALLVPIVVANFAGFYKQQMNRKRYRLAT